MVVGLGIDLVEISRVASACERFGDRFLKRLFSSEEIRYCYAFTDPAPHLAARFAAKEAVSKAFGTGIGARLGWLDIEVRNYKSGQPYVLLHDKGMQLLRDLGASSVHISLAHTREHAVAVAIIESLHNAPCSAR
ncbi:MAG: holo-ACP synthase [Verrucomicrobiae bacterium]|nr:holo-ACP synthase [Verrucomicrobiae bacterium]